MSKRYRVPKLIWLSARRHLARIGTVLALLASPHAHALAAIPNLSGVSIPGQLSINDRGYPNYTIPLAVPPGGGLTPSLQLAYGGIGTLSYLGHGWTLVGLSAITRGDFTVDVDGYAGHPTGNADDALYLDGARLVRIGTGPAGEVKLRAARADYASISAFNWGMPDQYFVVRTRAGLRLRLGGTTDSRSASGQVVHAWLVDEVADSSQNYYQVRYLDVSPYEKVPESIAYGGNRTAKLAPYAQIAFEYEAAKSNYRTYHYGVRQEHSRYMKAIVEHLLGKEERRYEISYTATEHWPGVELASVVLKSGSSTIPGPGFSYQTPAPAWTETDGYTPPASIGTALNQVDAIALGDIDGSGRDNLLFSYRANGKDVSQAYVGSAAGWTAKENLKLPIPLETDGKPLRGRLLLDINGDGTLDLLVAQDGVRRTFLRKNNAWAEDPAFALPFDLEKNGVPTVVRTIARTTRRGLILMWSDGTTSGALEAGRGGLRASPTFVPPRPFAHAGRGPFSAIAVDMDCDGMPELAYFGDDPAQARGAPVVYESTPTGWKVSSSAAKQFPADVRGRLDGYGLISLQQRGCRDLLLKMANGSSFALGKTSANSYGHVTQGVPPFPLPPETGPFRLGFQDADPDGTPAVAGVAAGGQLVCARWRNGAWQTCPGLPAAPAAASIDRVEVGDFDGNGRQDVLLVVDGSHPDKARAIVLLGNAQSLQPAAGFFPAAVKLASATDFFGVRFLDLNGDGLADILVLGDTRASRAGTAYLNTGSGWREEKAYSLGIDFGESDKLLAALQLYDFTSDGVPDAMLCVDGWTNAKNCRILENRCPNGPAADTQSCWADSGLPRFITPTHSLTRGDLGVRFVDLNTDGKLDVLLARQERDRLSERHAWLWDGSAWTADDRYAPPIDFVSAASEWNSDGTIYADLGVRLEDLDGDRRPDLFVNSPAPATAPPASPSPDSTSPDPTQPGTNPPHNALPCVNGRCAAAFLLTRSGWVPSAGYQAPVGPASKTEAESFWSTTADVNGDGLADLLTFSFSTGQSQAFINTGVGWEEDTQFAAPRAAFGNAVQDVGLHLIDVNADGLPDLVRVTRQPDGSLVRKAFLNTGSSWLAKDDYAPSRALSHINNGELGSRLIDVDGNGTPDLLFGLESAVGDTASRVVLVNSNRRAGLMLEVVEGLGARTTLEYAGFLSMARTEAARPDSNSTSLKYPLVRMNAPFWLVARTQTSVPGRPLSTHSFAFSDFALDVRRGIPVGPAWKRVVDDSAGAVVETTMLQDFHLEGLVASQQTYDRTSLRSAQQMTYVVEADAECAALVPNPCHNVQLTQSTETDYDPSGRAVASSQQKISYGPNGNTAGIALAHYKEGPGGPALERMTVTENTYEDDRERWLLGRLARAKVTHTAPGRATVTTLAAFTYDPTTGLLLTEHAYANLENSFVHRYRRDAFGNIVEAQNIHGDEVRTEFSRRFDEFGRFLVENCNALRQCERYRRRAVDGQLLEVRAADGLVSTYEYDDAGRVSSLYDGTSRLRTVYRSPVPGEPAASVFVKESALDTADPTIAYYDAMGAVIKTSKPGFAGRRITETFHYQANGALARKTAPGYAGERPRLWEYEYDVFGHARSIRQPGGEITFFESAGPSISVSTSQGLRATQSFTSERRVEKIVDSLGRTLGFHYDAAGRQDQVYLQGALQTEIRYDDAGRKIEVRDRDRGVIKYRYSAFGELDSVQTAAGDIRFRYDPIGRMVKRLTRENSTEWTYDAGPNAVGRLVRVSDSGGYVEDRRYQPSGKLSEIAYVVDNERFRERYEYAPNGMLRQRTSPTGRQTRYSYDNNGFVSAVDLADTGERVWTAVTYLADGRVGEAILGKNIRAVVHEDPNRNRIDRLALQVGGALVDDLRYASDAQGNVISRKDMLAGVEDTFTYDSANQLTGWAQAGREVERYAYDGAGNMVRKLRSGAAVFEASYAPDSHRIGSLALGGKPVQVAYDREGRMSRFGNTTLEYWSDGRPRSLRDEETQVMTRYGPGGAVYAEQSVHGSISTSIVRLGTFERIHARGTGPYLPSGESVVQRDYIVTPSGIAGFTEEAYWVFGGARSTVAGDLFGSQAKRVVGKSRTLQFVHNDIMGSPRIIMDQDGKIIRRLRFSPWGEGGAEQKIGAPDAYAGYNASGFASILRSGPRLYNPVLSAFMQPDPQVVASGAELGADLNPYVYSRNNPLSFADPSGLGWFSSVGDFFDHVGGAIVGAVIGGPVGGIVGGILGLQKTGQLIDQYWRPAVIIAAGVAITVASGGTLGPVAAAMIGGAVAGGLSAGLYGGSVTDILEGAIRGAVVGAIGGAAGSIASELQVGLMGQIAIGGVAGGYTNVINGGSFEQGFLVGAASAALFAAARNYSIDKTMQGRVMSRAVIGGTVATMEGGKFENGAATAAFAFAVEGAASTIGTADGNRIRKLSEGEIKMAKEMFDAKGMDSSIVKWEDVRVVNGRFFELDSGHAITPYGAIFMPPASFANDYSVSGESDLFKHEMVHVYQYYRNDSVAAKGLWEQTSDRVFKRNSYCTAGTQEYEASTVSGFGCN